MKEVVKGVEREREGWLVLLVVMLMVVICELGWLVLLVVMLMVMVL